MNNIKTITHKELEEFDLLFYRPSSFFGAGIALYDALCYWKSPKMLFRILFRLAFSHVGGILKDKDGNLRRYDAMEGSKTGFRKNIGECYVFTLELTREEKKVFKEHLLARKGSKYDRKGILSFLFSIIYENEFRDYCSELYRNALILTNKFPELSGKPLTPLSLYTALRPKLTFKGLLLSYESPRY